MDLTRIILSERGITVDEAGFEKAMDRQREESRKHWKGSGEEAVDSVWLQVAEGLRAEKKIPVFTGYTSFQETSPCLVSVPGQGNHKDLVYGVFARTPFYGESGGQAGDRGRVHGPDFEAEVIDVKKPVPDLTVATLKVRKGTLKVGQTYTQTTDAHHRALTAKNHTATHLLHWALREVLGKHVKQAGSLVSAELLRFDFAHFQALTSEELTRVENMVNEKIWSGDVVDKAEMSKDAAIAKGAIAFFGEKYGDQVRVVSVGGYSTELCGGTHVDRAGDIHLFKIANESGIAAGIRRIVAYTSKGAFDFLRGQDDLLKRLRDQVLASSVTEIEGKLERMLLAEKDLKKKIEQLQSQTAGAEVDDILKLAKTVGQTLVVASLCKTDPEGIKRLRELSEKVLQKAPNAVVVFGMKDETGQKAMLLSAVGPKASPKAKANAIIQTLAPMVGGRGGGKPDMAQAGGTDVAGLNKAIEHALGVLAPDWA